MRNHLNLLFIAFLLGIITAPAAWGEVFINEIMKDPNAVSDSNGEWFELYNDAPSAVNVNGWTISDNGGESHVINNAGPLLIPTNGYLVLCRNSNSAANGGVICAYQYSGFTLGNAGDEIILRDGVTEIDRVEYNNRFFPNLIGVSMEFSQVKTPFVISNDDGDRWGVALTTFGAGDRGTPGTQNNRPPVFTSTPITQINEDSQYSYTVTATDPENNPVTFGSQSLPSWLTFNPTTRVLSGTPTNSEVGTTILLAITASDGGAPAARQKFSVTVINTNDPPVAQNALAITNEDTAVTVILQYTDPDVGDRAETATVTNVTNGSITAPASCTNGVCTVGLTPSANSNSAMSTQFTVNDGEANSNSAVITVNVNAVNDAPVIATVPPPAQAVEGVPFTGLLVAATDVDNTQAQLAISSTGSSLPSWLTVDPNNPLRFRGTPRQTDVGASRFPVRVTDGQDLSAPANLSITVLPALAINNVRLNQNAVTAGGNSQPVQPQQQISLAFNVINNLPHLITGITAQVSSPSGFTAQTQTPVNLAAGASQSITLTGAVHFTTLQGTYPVQIQIQGRDFIDNRRTYSDAFAFNLMVQQNPADVAITNIILADPNGITCKPSTNLIAELTNRGSNTENDVVVSVRGGNGLNLSLPSATISSNAQQTFTFVIPAGNLSNGPNQLTVTASYRSNSQQATQTTTIAKGPCIQSAEPATPNVVVGLGVSKQFRAILVDAAFINNLRWFVDNVEVAAAAGRDIFTFQQNMAGMYTVKAVMPGEERVWQVRVTDRPAATNLQTNIPPTGTINNRTNFNLQVENNFGKILFTDGINLDALVTADLLNLDNLITISDGIASVNSATNPFTGERAAITLKRAFTNPVIQVANGFNAQSGFADCPATRCMLVRNANGEFVFNVTGFSTYRVVAVQPADLQLPAEAVFDNAVRGQDANLNVTVKNVGTTERLTNIQIQFMNVDSRFSAQITNAPVNLNAGEQATIGLKVSVPSNQAAGKRIIGDIQVTAANSTGTPLSKTMPLFVKTQSFLSIKSIEINGKTSGDLQFEEENEIKVELENKYTKDIDDVSVTVEILDVDGEDLEKESDEFDLNKGDEEEVTLIFDLRGEDLEEEKYKVRVKVQGEADDGTEHEDEQEITIKVDRENHNIIITRTSLGASTFQRNEFTSYH